MFSSHLQKINRNPQQYIFAGAGVLLVIGMLISIAMVASEQVKKAELRASLLASQRMAVMHCFETQLGSALNSCIVQAKATSDSESRVTTLADNSTNSAGFTRASMSTSVGGKGLIPVAFSVHR